MTTLTIMRYLPREVDPLVYNMSHEDPGDISYSMIGGLGEQIRELREVIELPLLNPELFQRVGITPPKGCLLYGPPGTGKTLLARAVASQIEANFLKVVSSAIVDKYIGESARLIREMFNYARDHQPCVIFMDEIDAIEHNVLLTAIDHVVHLYGKQFHSLTLHICGTKISSVVSENSFNSEKL
ncbi:UNVERIFIED_CONTAM: Psmc6 [Trichonephila clavipes]